MGILNQASFNRSKNSTLGFHFGHTEAEGEINTPVNGTEPFFEDYLEVLSQISNNRFIFVGRKGVGKSAIAKHLKYESDRDEFSYCSWMRYQEVKLGKLTQKIPYDSQLDVSVVIFEWLILTQIIKLIINSKHGHATSEYIKLKAFIEKNSGFVDIDKYSVNEMIEKKGLEVAIGSLKHAFGFEVNKHIEGKVERAPFYQLVPALKEIVSKVLNFEVYQRFEFVLLIDDLDIGFKAEHKESRETLLALLRATKGLNTSIFDGTKTKVFIFIRDDIKRILEYTDTDGAKIFSSYEITLNWYDPEEFRSNENQVPLKRFVDQRILRNFKRFNPNYKSSNPWNDLFDNSWNDYTTTSSFKYILDYTFYRPRDFILLLNKIGEKNYTYPIKRTLVEVLLKKYANAIVTEIKSELAVHFEKEDIDKIFQALREFSIKGGISFHDALSVLKDFLPARHPNSILNLLLEYGIIGYLDTRMNRVYFSYREARIDEGQQEQMNFTLQKAVYLTYL